MLFIFHINFFDGFPFHYFEIFIIFFLPKRFFLVWQFSSFWYFSFPIFHFQHGMFLYTKFHMIIIIIITYSLEFFKSIFADGLSLEFKSQQVSKTLLSILAVLNNTVVWMVSTYQLTSKSSSPFNNPLVTVTKAPITIGIIVTCMFHSFFNFLARSRYLSFFSHSFSFILWSASTENSPILQIYIFFNYYYVWCSGRD